MHCKYLQHCINYLQRRRKEAKGATETKGANVAKGAKGGKTKC